MPFGNKQIRIKYLFRNESLPLNKRVIGIELFGNESNPASSPARREERKKRELSHLEKKINLKVRSMQPLRNEVFEEKDRPRLFFSI